VVHKMSRPNGRLFIMPMEVPMSTIQFLITYCKYCMRPADQCGDYNELIQRGVPPDVLTYEIFTPLIEEVRDGERSTL
jgi:hypothetical protein